MIATAKRSLEVPANAVRPVLRALVAERAATEPEEIALRDPADRASWSGRAPAALTWRDLLERADRLASALARLGLEPGARIGLLGPAGSDFTAALIAVESAGLGACLLSLTSEPDELRHALEHADLRAVLVQGRVGELRPAATLADLAPALFRLRFIAGFGPGLPDGVLDLDAAPTGPSRLPFGFGGPAPSLVTFAAGGAVLRSLPSLVAACAPLLHALRPSAGDRIVSCLAADDLKGLATGLLPALLAGASFEPIPVFSAAALAEALARPGRVHLVAPAWAEKALRPVDLHGGSLVLVRDAAGALPSPEPALASRAIIDVAALGEVALLTGDRRTGIPAASPAGLDKLSGWEVQSDGSLRLAGLAAAGAAALPTPASRRLGTIVAAGLGGPFSWPPRFSAERDGARLATLVDRLREPSP
ncbi:MAG: acyl--CoA ligase [Methylobacteriaceae bacterium]|nr:acyl--CoA ligase [Methylobacteriaceae bacterium]